MTAEVDGLIEEGRGYCQCWSSPIKQRCYACKLSDALSRLQRELQEQQRLVEGLRKDAERYREFRSWWIAGWRVPQGNGMSLVTCTSEGFTGEKLDAAIDAAIKEKQ